jgi:tRNA (guanosine-2'-O-)-methyltransferase
MDIPVDRLPSYLDFLLEQLTPHKAALFAEKAAQRTRKVTVVLENMFQAHNASAVLRTCDCFGVQDVYIIEKNNLFSTTHQISLGSSRWLTLHRFDGDHAVENCYAALRKAGYSIFAATPHEKDVNMEDLECTQPIALVFGTELQGLSQEALLAADAYVKIPMVGFTESLNVSVSAAVCLHHLTWKLRQNSNQPMGLSAQEQLELKITWAENSSRRSTELREAFLRKVE